MAREPLTKAEILENYIREIASSAGVKGGEWASDMAFDCLDVLAKMETKNAP
jgi:hypothetical protein